MSNLANGRVIWKLTTCLAAKKFLFFMLNLHIVYELTIPNKQIFSGKLLVGLCGQSNSFPRKSCLFGTVKLVRKRIKSKFTYNGWRIAFDGEGSWSFGNELARNILIFGVENSSSSHTDNWKHNLLVLGEGPADGVNDGTGAAEKQ